MKGHFPPILFLKKAPTAFFGAFLKAAVNISRKLFLLNSLITQQEFAGDIQNVAIPLMPKPQSHRRKEKDAQLQGSGTISL